VSDLRVIVDQLRTEVPGGIGRYTADLTAALIETAPAEWGVIGVVSAADQNAIGRVRAALPGLDDLDVLPRSRRALSLAWELGLVSARDLPRGSATHGPSQFTPLAPSRGGSRVTVTIHDAVPWTHPETLTRYGAQWHRAMARRAARFADAIAVPTRAVANELQTWVNLGDRVHVIGGAPSDALALPADAETRAEALGLPSAYVLAVGTLEPRKGLDALVRAMASPEAPDLPLVVAGPPGWGDVDLASLAAATGLPPEGLIILGRVSDADLAVAYDRATVFAFPSRAEGFGLPVIEAMRLGAPVVHTDVPAVMEVAGGAGRIVTRAPDADFPARFAAELRTVVEDRALTTALVAAGRERATAFSWLTSAEQVWALHS